MTPYYNGSGVELYHGDALQCLSQLPGGLARTCVTSPPYWGLRDYGEAGQMGLEETPQRYVEKMVEVFAQVRRVLAEDGTLWLNLGDCYAGSQQTGGLDTSGLVGWGNKGSRKDMRVCWNRPQSEIPRPRQRQIETRNFTVMRVTDQAVDVLLGIDPGTVSGWAVMPVAPNPRPLQVGKVDFAHPRRKEFRTASQVKNGRRPRPDFARFAVHHYFVYLGG